MSYEIGFDLSAAELAREFALEGSLGQARFFNALGLLAVEHGGVYFSQLQDTHNAMMLNDHGLRVMRAIGELARVIEVRRVEHRIRRKEGNDVP